MAEAVDVMAGRGVFASIDLHNNTGCNPHYACLDRLDPPSLHLATLFSRTVVYFTSPRGVQAQALSRLCPAVTLECGKVGERHGVEHARDFLDASLHLSALPTHPVPAHDLDLFHTVARMRVPDGVEFGFDPGQKPLEGTIQFSPDLDRLNFRELPAGAALGWVHGHGVRLEVRGGDGRDQTAHYLEVEDGELRLRVPVMPSMLTRDALVIRQDCLGYLMERYRLDQTATRRSGPRDGTCIPG